MIRGVFHAYRVVIRLLLAVFVISSLIFVMADNVRAVAGINEQINFQGRLLNSSGVPVADGYYNLQFKLYQDGTGTLAGNPSGVQKWTESYLNNDGRGVEVRNGYLSVQLGSVVPFGTSVDWNQDTLWLSVNVGNTNTTCTPFTSCTPDGEMLPMKRLSSTPFALNSGRLGGKTAADFIQNTTQLQTGNIALQSAGPGSVGAVIQGATSQTADILQIKSNSSSTPLVAVGASGAVTFQPLSGASQALTINNSGGNAIMSVDNTNSRVTIGNASTVGDALSVTGSVNSSSSYKIGGTTTLTNSALTFSGGSPSSIQGATGQQLTIQGGNAPSTNTNGANVTISGGAGNGTGVSGLVVLTTPTFSTNANDSNCYTGGSLVANNCTVSGTSVNGSSSIIVGFNTDGKTATLPDPTITTAGRVIYLTAANGSKDFTLSVNGGGVGNQIAMRQNTTATMIWNGADWTAAGASSSTTLQAAYDNTLQSAGGAELVVSKTSATNGLTIRDSVGASAVNGTLLSVQTGSASSLISVNSNVTEYASNSGAETAGSTPATFPANTWSAVDGNATVSRNATPGSYVATGQGSVGVTSTATANTGVKNMLSSTLTANTTYNVSFTTRLASGTFTDMSVVYSQDGTNTASAQCTSGVPSVTSVWRKVNCTFKTPANGITANNAILIRQASGTARIFYIDNLSVTIAADYNFASDKTVSDGANFATNWSYSTGIGTGSVTRSTSDGNDASDSAQVTITSGAANAGVRNKLASNPLPSTQYRLTVYAKVASGSFNDFKLRYSRDGGTNYVDCVDYNTQSLSTSTWTKVTCYITTDATMANNPYVYFVEGSAAARTYMVDTFSMTLSSITTPNVQIGGGVNGGPTTLFTLDKGASAPIASDNESLLGSMYYDTTLGKLQCYEADGWGACGSSPDNIVTISPEYTNAVLHGTGVGTMTSDLCSDSLDINDGTSGQSSICGTNETYNFYKWTSPQASAQSYGIYVTYQLPNTFKEFSSGLTSIMGRTNSTNSNVNYQVYRNNPTTGLVPCGSTVGISSGSVSSWQTGTASGAADPSTCGFEPGDSIVFKITATASQNSDVYIGNLNFTFSNR